VIDHVLAFQVERATLLVERVKLQGAPKLDKDWELILVEFLGDAPESWQWACVER